MPHESAVDFLVFILLVRSERRLCRKPGAGAGAGAGNRKFPVDRLQSGIGVFGLLYHRCCCAAVGAVVIKELHKRDLAFWVAGNRGRRIDRDVRVPLFQAHSHLLYLHRPFGVIAPACALRFEDA